MDVKWTCVFLNCLDVLSTRPDPMFVVKKIRRMRPWADRLVFLGKNREFNSCQKFQDPISLPFSQRMRFKIHEMWIWWSAVFLTHTPCEKRNWKCDESDHLLPSPSIHVSVYSPLTCRSLFWFRSATTSFRFTRYPENNLLWRLINWSPTLGRTAKNNKENDNKYSSKTFQNSSQSDRLLRTH